MKIAKISGIGMVLVLSGLLGLSSGPQDLKPGQQTEPPVKKTPNDYINTALGRNAKALGLKDDQTLSRMFKEPSINWAVRAAARHILD
ncbi:MAG: hypothetical protein ABSF88_13090 [Candidatus Aminicenantales bacterium]|jgi:hypothetical protein